MKTITFEKASNENFVIKINGIKAGLVCLLSRAEFTTDLNTSADWRVFFWGKYNQYQVKTELFKSGVMASVKLSTVIENIEQLYHNSPEVLFREDDYESKGHVLLHATNGDVLSINTEYDYSLTEHYHMRGNYILFDNAEKLNEITEKLLTKYNDGSMWFGLIEKVEFKMFEPIFDTSYYK